MTRVNMTERFKWINRNMTHLPSTSELFSSGGVDSVADGTTTEKVLSVIYILGIYKNWC